MAGTDLDPDRTLTPYEALARAIDQAIGSNNWRGHVTYDEDDDVLTIHSPDGTTIETPVLGGGGGGGLSLDPDAPADYEAATGILTLTFTDGSTLSTGDLRGQSAFQIAQANGFTGTEAQWAALTNPPLVEITASRALAASDLYKRLRGNSASAITLTVPADATADLAMSRCPVENVGAGPLTVAVEAGATLNGVAGGSIDIAQYQAAAIEKIAADTWIVPNAQVA